MTMRAKRIYVGNLPFSSDEDELETIFGHYGDVVHVDVIVKRDNGRPRGFAYVEMSCHQAAARAIQEMDGVMLSGRSLKVALARPLDESDNGNGNGNGNGHFDPDRG